MGKALTKDLVQAIAAKKKMTLKEAEEYVDAFFSVVSEGLHREGVVKIKGFGTFKLIEVRDRESVDVNTGERMTIEGHTKMTFTPEATLRDMVNKPFSQFETVVVNDGVDLDTLVSAENNESIEGEIAENAELTEGGDVPEKASVAGKKVEFNVTSDEADITKSEQVEAELSEEKQPSDPMEFQGDAYEEPIIDTGDKIEDMQSRNEESEGTSSIDIRVEGEKAESSDKSELETSAPLEGKKKDADEHMHEPQEVEDASLVGSDTLSVESSHEDNGNQLESDGITDVQTNKKSSGLLVKVLIAFVAVLVVVAGFFAGYLYAESKLQDKSANDNVASARQNVVPTKGNAQKRHSVAEQDKAKHNESSANSSDSSVSGREGIGNAKADVKDGGQITDAKKANEEALRGQNAANDGQGTNRQSKESKEENVKSASSDKKLATAKRYVETGAYRIVGVDRSYKVKSGETIGSIARRFLGDGMDCYLQVCNGKADVAEGDMLKIPKLELKTKKK